MLNCVPIRFNHFNHKVSLLALSLVVFVVFYRPAYAQFTTPKQTITLENGTPLYFHQKLARNSTVILLGGGPGFSSWNLEPIQTQLQKQGHSTYLMDMRGIGENSHLTPQTPEQSITQLWVQDIESLRQHISHQSHKKVILVGHSWGALMAMLYSRAYPENVKQLILLNPVDPQKNAMRDLTENIHEKNQQIQQAAWDDENAWDNAISDLSSEEQARKITELQITQVLPTYFYDYQQGQAYAKLFDHQDFNIDLNVNAWKAYDANPITFEQIRSWQLPIDFLDCRQDSLMPENLHALEGNQVLRKVVVLDQCSHFPWVEQPAAFKQSMQMILRPAN